MNLWGATKRALFALEPEEAHHFTLGALELAQAVPGALALTRVKLERPALATAVAGVPWPNCVGLAAGLDKNAQAPDAFFSLGFGAVEVGTVTLRPQPGNPRPRLFRLRDERALINRMGFNNDGAQAMAARLAGRTFPGALGINLGKNKDTPNEAAAEDYVALAKQLGPFASYLVVNLSSPNTPGLRALQAPEALAGVLTATTQATTTPVLLKIAPDLEDEAIDAAVDVALSCGVGGIIATNTTLARPVKDPLGKEAGGLSGAPLRDRSTRVLARCHARARGRLSLVGVGGISTVEHVLEKLRAGASAVQLYSGLIYEGPGLVRRLLDGLEQAVQTAKVASIAELTGHAG